MKIGDRVGKYLVTDKLGEGGMGVVFGAQHEGLGRDVAIKVLHGQFARRADLMERFWREAEAVSGIGHPNIVAVYDFGKLPDGSLYYVMERVRGETLRQRLRREPPMARDELARVFVQICRALAATHARGITHRDLKPENVLLQTQATGLPHVKVLDYGIAKVRDAARDPELTGIGAILGTPQYMAPEQVAAAQLVDGRADLYSLGAMLYEVYTGKPPFMGEGIQVMMAQMKDAVVPPSQRATRELPAAMESLILRALAKPPEERPADAAAFATELELALGLPPSAVPIPAQPPAPPSAAAPRRGGLLILAALAGLALALGGGYLATRPPALERRLDAVLSGVLAGETARRLELAELLAALPAGQAPAPLLVALVNDDNPEVRRVAARATIGVADPALDAALAAAEERSGGQVAIDLALVRANRPPYGALPATLETLGGQLDPIGHLRFQRARFVRQQVGDDALYRAALAAERAPLAERAAALARYRDKAALQALAADPARPSELRVAAALALDPPAGDATLQALGPQLAPGDRALALLALAPRDAAADRELRALATGGDPERTPLAALAASQLKSPPRAGLTAALAADDARVQLAAALALRVLSAAERRP